MEEKITPEITRFKGDGLSFSVIAKIEEAEDVGGKWQVLQSTLSLIGNWPRYNKKMSGKIIIMSGDEIRAAIIKHKAETDARSLVSTGGTTTDLVVGSKRIIVRNGKPQFKKSLADVREAILQLRRNTVRG